MPHAGAVCARALLLLNNYSSTCVCHMSAVCTCVCHMSAVCTGEEWRARRMLPAGIGSICAQEKRCCWTLAHTHAFTSHPCVQVKKGKHAACWSCVRRSTAVAGYLLKRLCICCAQVKKGEHAACCHSCCAQEQPNDPGRLQAALDAGAMCAKKLQLLNTY